MLKITVEKNHSEIEATEKEERLITEAVYAAVGLADVISRVTGLTKADSAEFLAVSVKKIEKAGLQKYIQDVTAVIPDELLNKILDEDKGTDKDVFGKDK